MPWNLVAVCWNMKLVLLKLKVEVLLGLRYCPGWGAWLMIRPKRSNDVRFQIFQSNDVRFRLLDSNDVRFRLCSTLPDIVRLCLTLFNYTGHCSTLFDWLERLRFYLELTKLRRNSDIISSFDRFCRIMCQNLQPRPPQNIIENAIFDAGSTLFDSWFDRVRLMIWPCSTLSTLFGSWFDPVRPMILLCLTIVFVRPSLFATKTVLCLTVSVES